MNDTFRFGILLSGKGRGSNMQALIDATRDGRIPGRAALVVSTTPGAPAVERAREAGVPTEVVPAAEFPEPELLDRRLVELFDTHGCDAICLAGYMRLLSPAFLARFPLRILNVHPSLLPAFGGHGFYGKRVHQAVIESGVKWTGVTVQFVDEEFDHGPIILQKVTPVEDDDTPESVAARVLALEHQAYPEAVRLLAEGRLRVEGRRVYTAPGSAQQ